MEVTGCDDRPLTPSEPMLLYGEDESMAIIACEMGMEGVGGWIVLNRYKSRGRWTSALHLGDHPPRRLTLQLVERTIRYYETRTR